MNAARQRRVPAGAVVAGVLSWVLLGPWSLAATLRDLAPVQVYAVAPARALAPLELGEDAAPAQSWDLDLSLASFFTRGQGIGLPPALRGGVRTSVFNRRTTWLSGLSSTGGWRLGSQNWRYADGGGLGLVVGNEWTDAPVWGSTVRMGGLRIVRAPQAGGDAVGAEPWAYSLTVGALDYSGDPGTEGGLVYGPMAGAGTVQYEIDPAFTLASQLEFAPEMVAAGVGGRYDTGDWGAWSAGIAQATHDRFGGWSYQTAYEVELLEGLRLSWSSQRRSIGFSDLAHYRDFSPDSGLDRMRWDAALSLGRWGELVGSYDSRRTGAGEIHRSVGLGQQFWLSPRLHVSLTAGRSLDGRDYDVGLGLAVPLF